MPVKRFPTDATAAEIRSLSPELPVAAVAEIIDAVSARGDAAVAELEQKFRGASSSEPLTAEAISEAASGVSDDLRSAIETAIANVRSVAREQLAGANVTTLPQGQSVAYKSISVARAGVYVPGGRGSYPSTAIMCLSTAREAGVEDIAVVSPAREGGSVDPAVLLVCELLGVTEVHPIGGAQAIAALGLGTQHVKKCDVIVGPGNSYVQEAKRQLVGVVAIDSVAGPSELVVVADDSADPEAVALDLLAQGEHGPDSLVALVSPDPDLLDAVADRCVDIDAEMALVLAADLDAAVQLADEIAPEHLQIISQSREDELAGSVRNAGCLFVGANAATAFGDYVVGSNHVLPTGGSARYASALSVRTFTRRMATVKIPDAAVDELSRAGATIARAEGFIRHAESMEIRRKKTDREQ